MSLILDGTNGLSDVDGTAGTPAIRGSDANTGIFFPAADTIAFAEGGVESMRLNSSGNVGIGTSSPVSLGSGYGTLDVRGSTGGGYRWGNATDSAYTYADTDGAVIATATAKPLILSTNNSERARIDSSGNLLVGTTSNPASTKAIFKSSTDNSALSVQGATSGQGGGVYYRDGSSGNGLFSTQADSNYYYVFDSDGSHYAYFAQNGTSWSFSSDRRIKRDIVDIDYGLNAVMAMQPRRFTYDASGKNDIGFIAQELRVVIPEAVSGEEQDFVDGETNIERAAKTLGVSKDALIPVLVKAIQELKAINDAQAQTIESLTARVVALEGA